MLVLSHLLRCHAIKPIPNNPSIIRTKYIYIVTTPTSPVQVAFAESDDISVLTRGK